MSMLMSMSMSMLMLLSMLLSMQMLIIDQIPTVHSLQVLVMPAYLYNCSYNKHKHQHKHPSSLLLRISSPRTELVQQQQQQGLLRRRHDTYLNLLVSSATSSSSSSSSSPRSSSSSASSASSIKIPPAKVGVECSSSSPPSFAPSSNSNSSNNSNSSSSSSSSNSNSRRKAIKRVFSTSVAAGYAFCIAAGIDIDTDIDTGIDIDTDIDTDNNNESSSLKQTASRAHHHPPVANAIYENGPNVETPIISLPSGVTYQDLRIASPSSTSSSTSLSSPTLSSSSSSSSPPPVQVQQTVQIGNRVNIQWVLKRSNGYYIDSSSNDDGIPFIFTVGSSSASTSSTSSNSISSNTNNNNSSSSSSSSSSTSTSTIRPIVGLDEGIIGMTLGGIRRIVIPLEKAYVEGVEDGKPGPVPRGFGPKQRVRRVMELLKDDIPGERIVLDVKVTRIQ